MSTQGGTREEEERKEAETVSINWEQGL